MYDNQPVQSEQIALWFRLRLHSSHKENIQQLKKNLKNMERFTNLRVILAQGPC